MLEKYLHLTKPNPHNKICLIYFYIKFYASASGHGYLVSGLVKYTIITIVKIFVYNVT